MDHTPILRDTVLRTARRALRHHGNLSQAPLAPSPDSAGKALRAGSNDQPGYEEARVEGYSAGLEKGLAAATLRIAEEIDARKRHLVTQFNQAEARLAADLARQVAVLDGLIRTVERAADAQLRTLEGQAIALALEALCKIMCPNAGRDQLLVDLVKQGLTRLRDNALLAVRMHPADLAEMTSSPGGRALVGQRPRVQWTADSSLERGGCLLESEHGSLDVGLHAQVDRLRELWASADSGEGE